MYRQQKFLFDRQLFKIQTHINKKEKITSYLTTRCLACLLDLDLLFLRFSTLDSQD